MNTKHRKTLEAIFHNPVNSNLEWKKIEALLVALGAKVVEGNGSQVSFYLGGKRLDVHRPHPRKEALKYRVKLVRQFLENAGVNP
ncbi:HicA protein [Nitrosococcus halophilus Nc 4]|uniref:HicA protein n=1 Tax=Nitrosococcus halophilus (strain Nc4) TaxID=472759 RepID=D5BZ72_NITHN|nr:type II toxin-antitoxin system HicA family toxin [Nitrosococcus halophilus]ADE16086.1 HicA protein [Nitrosococcus halophilus Nc 4]